MRLYSYYINESTKTDLSKLSTDEIASILKKECSEIIKMYDYKKDFIGLYRGIKNLNYSRFAKIIPRSDRKPLDMKKEFQIMFDKLLEKKFGWKPRSEGVFAIRKRYNAYRYGIPYYFFPINGFKYVWSPDVFDLYNATAKFRHLNDVEIERIIKELSDSYIDVNLEKHIHAKDNYSKEISFYCPKGYYVLIDDGDIDNIMLNHEIFKKLFS